MAGGTDSKILTALRELLDVDQTGIRVVYAGEIRSTIVKYAINVKKLHMAYNLRRTDRLDIITGYGSCVR